MRDIKINNPVNEMEATRADENERSGTHDTPGGATAPAAAPRFGDVSPNSDEACRLVPLRRANLDGFMTVRPNIPRVSFERPQQVAPVPPAAAAARAAPVPPAPSALRPSRIAPRESRKDDGGGFLMFSQEEKQNDAVYDAGATNVPPPAGR